MDTEKTKDAIWEEAKDYKTNNFEYNVDNNKEVINISNNTKWFKNILEKFTQLKSSFWMIQKSLNNFKDSLKPRSISHDELLEIYFDTFKTVLEINKLSLNLDLKHQNWSDFIDKWKYIQLPYLMEITITSISWWDNRTLNLFLENSIPSKLPIFKFNYSSSSSLLNLSTYLYPLKNAARRTTQSFAIYGMYITDLEFSSILNSSVPYCRTLSLNDCYISIAKPFVVSVSNPVLHTLSLNGLVHNIMTPEENYLRFRCIFRSLSSITSLKKVEARWWGLNLQLSNKEEFNKELNLYHKSKTIINELASKGLWFSFQVLYK